MASLGHLEVELLASILEYVSHVALGDRELN
jgi:hypothetical protein